MKKYCLALDLKDDPQLIDEYVAHHRNVAPGILKSITDSGIQQMEIYRAGHRLFMIIEVNEGFSFEQKAKNDAANPEVQVWEDLTWKYQQALPFAKPGEKWVLMDKIFEM